MLGNILAFVRESLFVVNIIFAIVIIFFERKSPSATLTWIAVLVFVPYIGFLVYLVLGLDSRKFHAFIIKSESDSILREEFFEFEKINDDSFHERDYLPDVLGSEKSKDLMYLNNVTGKTWLTNNNEITIFNNGIKKFEQMIKDIDEAKEFVHIQYYIVRDDKLGNKVVDALAKASKRNVEVKFIIDGMGCQFTSKKMFEPLKDSGGELGIFNPPILVRLNYRNHRKICIIDGKLGYIGGLNIGDEYLGLVKKYGPWRDSHIKIEGDSIKHLELRFIMDWNFCSKNLLSINEKYIKPARKFKDGVPLQIINSGPDTELPAIQKGFFKMIFEAEKNIYIESPYFVPNESILEALRVQALSGVDIKIVIPANPDHPFVYGAAIYYLRQLMEVGVKCYLYKEGEKDGGFTHSKIIMIDGAVVSVGTANMDIRSFQLNFETNAFIYDKGITRKFEKDFLQNLDNCLEISIDWYEKQSFFFKINEAFSRLLSSLL